MRPTGIVPDRTMAGDNATAGSRQLLRTLERRAANASDWETTPTRAIAPSAARMSPITQPSDVTDRSPARRYVTGL